MTTKVRNNGSFHYKDNREGISDDDLPNEVLNYARAAINPCWVFPDLKVVIQLDEPPNPADLEAIDRFKRSAEYAPDTDKNKALFTIQDLSADISSDEYLNRFAQKSTMTNRTAVVNGNSANTWKLPWTNKSDESLKLGTVTGSITLIREIVNHIGNTWYEYDTGTSTRGFIYSGDVTLQVTSPYYSETSNSTPTTDNTLLQATINNPSNLKLVQGGFKLGTSASNLSIVKTDQIPSSYQTAATIPCSYDLKDEYSITLQPGTTYYYQFFVAEEGKLDSPYVSDVFSFDTAAILVTSISLSPTSKTLDTGETVQLNTTVFPSNATNKAVTWRSSNTGVATVSDTGLVTAKEEGTATITVTAADGSEKFASATITVEVPTVVITSGSCGANGADVTYSLSDQGTLTISGTGAMYDFGWDSDTPTPLTPWYKYCSQIKKLVIEQGVTTISDGAFHGCYNLTSVSIADSVTSIGICAFQACDGLTTITIPKNVKTIGDSAFNSCLNLTALNVAEGNTCYTSQDGILYSKDKTELLFVPAGVTGTITIPDGVASIAKNAFFNCYNRITAITIPTSVTSIDPESFNGCDSLTDIYYLGNGIQWEKVAAEIHSYQINYATVHTTEDECILRTGICGDDLTYTLTKDYALIITGSGAMKDFEDVYDIPWYNYAEQIISITLPEGLTSISQYAFAWCQSLTSITIPSTVTTIDSFAFAWGWYEGTVTIPASVTHIGNAAFVGVGDLAVENGNTSFTADDKGALYNKTKTELLQVPYLLSGSYAIPSTVTKIAPYAFYNCLFISAVIIPDSVTEIGYYAFPYCESLTSITIPKSVTTIGDGAFNGGGLTKIQVAAENPNYTAVNGLLTNKAKTTLLAVPAGLTGTLTVPSGITTIGEEAFTNCSNLTSVTIPNGVASLSDWLFGDCTSLNRIVLPDTITYIGYGVFEGSGLTDIYYAGTEAQWAQIYIEDDTLLGPTAVTIHFGEEAPNYTGRGTCGDDLTWILEDGTLTISGTGAMYDFGWDSDTQTPLTPWYKYRSQIKKLVIEKGVTTIGEEAFDGCYNMTSVSIADSVTSIGIWAFQACDGLTTITIPKIVKTIGDGAFSGCLNLTAFKVASGNTSFKASNGLLMTYDGKVLVSAAGGLVGNVTVPKGVTTIRDWAFGSCRKISGIILPDMLTTIGEAAFWDCESLTSITIPNGVTSICNSMFQYCFELTRVTLPAGITEIEPGAFYECNKLTDVYYAGTQEQWGAISIGDGNSCLDNATIHIETLGSLEIRPVEAIRLVSGQSQTLTAYDLDGKKVTVTWSVDNSDAATITSAGKLTAKAVDAATTVTVTATDKTGAAGTKTITILPKVTSVTIGDVETTVDMYATSTLTLTATTAPEDALNDVTWVSGNEKVATVDETGTVTLLKPGTVTITATATDGSKKSAKVTLTVYYLDKATKLTATSDAPALGLQPGQTATVTVSGSGPLEASALYFSIPASQQNIATVDENTGVVTAGATPGTATVTVVIRNDPLNRKTTCKVKVIDMQAEALELSAVAEDPAQLEDDMVILDAKHVSDGTYTFAISTSATNYKHEDFTPTVTWASGNTAIATVKDNGDGTATVTVKKGASGECAITATARDLGKASAQLWLSVRDYAPRLENASPAMNLYQASHVNVALLTSYENSIVSVSLYEKEELSQHFTAAWEDGALTITALEGTGKGTFTQTLKVTCINGETYEYTLKIKVTETAPAVTVKQTVKPNLFYTHATAALTLTAKNAQVTDAVVTGGDFVGSFADDVLTLTSVVPNPARKVTLEITIAGYEKPVEKTMTLATVTTAPKLKLSATSSTINTALSADCSTSFQVLNGTEALELTKDDITCSGNFATYDVDKDAITLTLTGEKGGTATLNIQKSNWTKPVKLTHKVTVQTALPTLKLAASTLKLNSVFPDVAAECAVSLSQANLALTNVEITSKISGLDEVLSVSCDNGRITAKITGAVKAGTYSYICTGYVGEAELKPVTLKITVSATTPRVKLGSTTFKLNRNLAGQESVGTKVTVPAGYTLVGFDGGEDVFSYEDGCLTASLTDEADLGGTYILYPVLKPDGSEEEVSLNAGLKVKVTTYSAKVTATVAAKGKLDTLNPDSAITYTVKLKNCAGTISDAVSLSGQDGDLFQAEVRDGKVIVTMLDDAEYATGRTYKVTLDMIACGQDVSVSVSFKVTQSALKLTLTPSSVTCYQALGRGSTTLKCTSPVTAQIAEVSLNAKTSAAFLMALGENELQFAPDTGRVTFHLAHPGLLTPGKSYTLCLDVTPRHNAANVKPTQVRLTIKVQK